MIVASVCYSSFLQRRRPVLGRVRPSGANKTVCGGGIDITGGNAGAMVKRVVS